MLLIVVLRVHIEPSVYVIDGKLCISSTHTQITFGSIGNLPCDTIGSIGQFSVQSAPIQLNIVRRVNQLVHVMPIFFEQGLNILSWLNIFPLFILIAFQPDTVAAIINQLELIVDLFMLIELRSGRSDVLKGVRDIFICSPANGKFHINGLRFRIIRIFMDRGILSETECTIGQTTIMFFPLDRSPGIKISRIRLNIDHLFRWLCT